MECWVSTKGKKGVWSSFLKKFLENIKNVFWYPLEPPYKQNENFTFKVLDIKIR